MSKIKVENSIYTGSLAAPVEPETAAGETMDAPEDMLAPVSGNVERLGAAYRIKATKPYDEPANWQPTRASAFYGWSTGR